MAFAKMACRIFTRQRRSYMLADTPGRKQYNSQYGERRPLGPARHQAVRCAQRRSGPNQTPLLDLLAIRNPARRRGH